MDRIWLKNYPPGVPADIDAAQYPSLVALFEESFAKYKNANAYACMDKKLTYGQLDEMSQALGAWLQSKGLQRGDRVAIMMPNVLQYPVCVAGILRAGYVVVNVNPLYTPRELEHQLKDSGAKAIVIIENFAKTLEQVLAKTPVQHIVLASMGDLLGFPKGTIVNLVVRKVKKMVPAFSLPGAIKFNDAIAAGRRLKLNKPDIKRDDVAFLQYTGGTTGVSKGATLLHRNVDRQRAAERGLAAAGAQEGQAGGAHDHRHGAAALPHLRAHRVLPARHAHRRHVPADSQSARHPGLHQGARQVRVPHAARGQHALQRAAQQPGVRQARLHLASRLPTAAAWRCSGRWRSASSSSRAAPSSRATACRRPRRR